MRPLPHYICISVILLITLSACTLVGLNVPPEQVTNQILINPLMNMMKDPGGEIPGWRLSADSEYTLNLKAGKVRREGRDALRIRQDGTREGYNGVNAWVQRIDNPTAGMAYRLYLEFGTRQITGNTVFVDVRCYDVGNQLIEGNSWIPDVEGTIDCYWVEMTGIIPPGCAFIELLSGLKESSAGSFLLYTARLSLHEPRVPEPSPIEPGTIQGGGLRLEMAFEDSSTMTALVELETRSWHPILADIARPCDYTLTGNRLVMKLEDYVRYYPAGGFREAVIGYEIRITGQFEHREGDFVYGPFDGIVERDYTWRWPPIKGLVKGYLLLNGTVVDSLRVVKD